MGLKRRVVRLAFVLGAVVFAVGVVVPLVQATLTTAPSAPTLSSATPANTAVNLTWTTPTSNGGATITAYKVYRGPSSGSLSLVATLGVVNSYSNTGLTNGTTYYFAVTAVNSAGESVKSNVLSAIPATTVTNAPVLLTATAGNAVTNLTWATPTDNGGLAITAYKIYRGTSAGSLSLIATLGVVNSYSNTGLTNGTAYYFAVSAVNSKGESIKSNVMSATPAPTATNAPVLSSATAGNATVALAWVAPTDNGGAAVSGYKVYRGTTSGSTSLVATLGVVTSYSDTSLTNGTTYYYAVTAVNSAGESVKSNELSATPVTVPGAPTLSSATPGNASVALAWSAPASNGGSAIMGYKVYRGPSAGSLSLVTTLGVVTSSTDSGLTNGRTEGRNLIIKAVKRTGFGFTNFDNYRLRVLYRCT